MLNTRKKIQAFSLVELAVVIVVITSILFVLTRSTEFLEDSKVKLLAKESANIIAVATSFKHKFRYWPGDLPDAATYFGCTSGSAPSGCNGNANELIDEQNESYRFFEHLNLADFLPVVYSGVANGSEPYSTVDNLFSSAVISGGFYYPNDNASSDEYPDTNRNKLTLGRFIESYTEAQIGALTPRDAMSYDLKYDDGKPRTGKVMARTFLNLSNSRDGISSTLCLSNVASATIANISASTYTASSDLELCELIFFIE